MPNSLRPSWIQQGQMLPRLTLNFKQDKALLARVTEALQARNIPPSMFIPLFRAAERGASQAKAIALRIGEAFDRFFHYLAVNTLQSSPSSSLEPLPPAPIFKKEIEVLAQNLILYNSVIQQNLEQFNFDVNLEDEEEEIQSENLQNNFQQTSPFQNTPSPQNSPEEEETKKTHIGHALKKEIKRELAIESIIRLTPKIKEIVKEVKEISKITMKLAKPA